MLQNLIRTIKQKFKIIPVILRVTFGPRGTLLVRRGVPTRVDVFDDTGAYVGTLDAVGPLVAALVDNDRVVAVVSDESDVDRLIVYRVRREP